MPGESKLINKFKKYILSTYKNAHFYKLYSGCFSKAGYPDLIIKLPTLEATLNVECKDCSSLESAKKALRATQIGTMKELYLAGAKVILLFNGGCGLLSSIDLKFSPFHDSLNQFDSFERLLCMMKTSLNS